MRHFENKLLQRIDLDQMDLPERWYNVVPDLPRAPEEYLDAQTEKPVSTEYLEELLPASIVAQEVSAERWI